MRRLVCLTALTLALASASAAQAEGGPSVASAPTIAVGQQEFGKVPFVKLNECRNWWLLPLTVGDNVAIDWEVADPYIELRLYPPGTSDFNFPQQHTLAQGSPNSNKKAEFTYTASVTGDAPMLFTDPGCYGNAEPGPYNFTTFVTHALVVGLPRVGALRRAGTLTIPVHNPEGGPISNPAVQVELQIKGRGAWQTIGRGSVTNSAALVHFNLPARLRRQRVTLRVLAAGPGYIPAASAHLKLRTL